MRLLIHTCSIYIIGMRSENVGSKPKYLFKQKPIQMFFRLWGAITIALKDLILLVFKMLYYTMIMEEDSKIMFQTRLTQIAKALKKGQNDPK